MTILLAAAAETNNVVTSAVNNMTDKVSAFQQKLLKLAEDHGPQAVTAILILVAGFIVAKWTGNLVQRWLDKQQMEPPIKTLFVRVARLLIMLAVLIEALDTAGFRVTTIIAGLGVAGVGVGLALQGVLGNLVAGLTIIFTKPFRVGEYVEIVGVYGQVKHIELFSTALTHPDMSTVIVPNRKIVGEVLHNYGKIRQLDLAVGVGYGSDPVAVLALVNEILAANPRVLKTPPPVVGISALGDSTINIAVKPWTSVPDYNPAAAEIYEAILTRFRAQKIEIPFPQREVRLLNQP